MDAKHCAVQCREWTEVLDRTYKQCMSSAKNQDRLSILSSGAIIVLNVVIVGANDLKLTGILVSIFVIIMTVVKSLQLKFQYDVCGSELHACKAGLRAVKISVRELCNEAECTGSVEKSEFSLIKGRVSQALEAVPNYISVEPKPPHVWQALVPGKTASKAAYVADEPGVNKDTELLMAPKPEISAEAVHGMMPPQATDAANEAVQEAGADIVVEVQAQALAVKCEVQKIILQDMIQVLGAAVPAVSKAAKTMGWIIGLTTTLELTLNALIMAFRNIPGLDFLGDAVAIFASVNAVQKGLLMKLDLDVKRKTVQSALSKMKTLLQTANIESLSMEATGEVNKCVVAQLKTDFSGIIDKYATFLPH